MGMPAHHYGTRYLCLILCQLVLIFLIFVDLAQAQDFTEQQPDLTASIDPEPEYIPPLPACKLGDIGVLSIGPAELDAPLNPDKTFTFTLSSSYGAAGEIRVYQAEGHGWDADCLCGPLGNDNGRIPCDQGEEGEVIEFYLNGVYVNRFVDHNPEDDCSYSYKWSFSNASAGINTLYLTNSGWNDSVLYRGRVCVEFAPYSTPTPPTSTPTVTPTSTPTATPSSTPIPPLAISLTSFQAVAHTSDILLAWETTSEINNLGFNLYRALAMDGKRKSPGFVQSEREFLAFVPSQAPGGKQGFSYEWVDSDATPGETYLYWLEDVDTRGTAMLHGVVSATIQVPTAITLSGAQAATDDHAFDLWIFAVTLALLTSVGLLLRRSNLLRSQDE